MTQTVYFLKRETLKTCSQTSYLGVYKRAIEAGATSVQEPIKKEDEDKRGGVKDAGGTTWWIATKLE